MNNVVILGRATRDPELRYTQGGTAVTSLNVAVDRNMSKENKERAEAQGQPTADFINVTAWAGTAEFIANYLKKGNRVAIQGRIQTGKYENEEGRTIYTTDVVANNVEIIDWPDRKESGSGIEGFESVEGGNIPF